MKQKLTVWTAFSILLLAGRMAHSGSLSYAFLAWNLFLAWLPYLIATYIRNNPFKGIQLVGLLAVWLLFLPNAPYIITDLTHLRERPQIPIWFDSLLLFNFSFLGLMFGLMSFYSIHQTMKKYVSSIWQPVLLALCSFLTGFGIYLGRVERWNSWDLFTHPFSLLEQSAALLYQQPVWIFTITYGLCFLCMYYIILSLINLRYETSGQLG